MLTDSEKKNLDELLENYGNREVVQALSHVMSWRGHLQSDLGLKEQAKESAEWSDLLSDLLVE